MVFSSFVFLLVFLPVALGIYYLLPARFRNLVLLVASLIFYMWGEPIYVLLMLFSTVFNYGNGRIIAGCKRKGQIHRAKAFLVADVCGNLGILLFFKYGDFIIQNINSISGAGLELLHLALPLGISFYTFQTMSYTIDVYRGCVQEQKNFIRFATYVTMFPQLIAGPVVRYEMVEKDLSNRKYSLEEFSKGAFLFTVGLAKKVLLANQLGIVWENIRIGENVSVVLAWMGAVAFSLQIYFDFSGYSDMAVGLGQMLGFHFPKNFNFPYMSKSITEFWRRWHITLGSWFRDYVYIPLGGNRKGLPRQILNLLVVWLLTGFWHGAGWNFAAWGLYYAVLLILEKLFLGKVLQKIPHWLARCYSLVLIVVGWMIFEWTDFGGLGQYLQAMFGVGHSVVDAQALFFLRNYGVLLLVAILCSINWKEVGEYVAEWHVPSGKVQQILQTIVMVVLFLLSVSFLAGDAYNPFMYFRF